MEDAKEYNQYMVALNLPEEMDMQFINLIPKQRKMVNDLFTEKVLLTYTLSLDRKRLWATILAETESEVIEIMESFPLTQFMTYEIHPLMFNEIAEIGMPAISLN
ncbi:MAG: muconolactone delta-isomerase [Maribacter sp.]|jgi:muconolactone delta-isomerase